MQAPLVKLCGLRTAADVAVANAAQPDFAGFVVDVAGKRRSIPLAQAVELASSLDPTIRPVGVFVDAPVETVNRFLTEAPNAAVQLHGSEDAAYIASLRSAARLQTESAGDPAKARIIQAFRVETIGDTLQAAASAADLVLLDSGQGSGRTFDWRLLTGFPRAFLLAGGLSPDNLAQAMAKARNAAGDCFKGVDMSSSLETDGAKDPKKMLAAVRAARHEATAAT
ncbi:phosphoribosylanthranilate isomerase [uncultured Senegalimassilia sp.]|uniref:phosphoribosylanthranilate isomerase n=1 Tax=uncultured Senegalimassilia sp. TaxID=1714350 RepID=UPI0025E95A3E|nr:phosphoribosylanthranilate isomerase [uncultured Senegalimassilia sp.]